MVVVRNPELTRSTILQAAFDQMYEHGYQGMRLDAILEETGLTKGALYHHFPNKLALAHAVVDEVIREYMFQRWQENMDNNSDLLVGLQQLFKSSVDNHPEIATKGCPLNNLIQEMSSIDQGFQERLNETYVLWCNAIADTLRQGQEQGIVKPEIQPCITATFLISVYQGVVGTAKCMQSMNVLQQQIDMLCDYIESLRP